MLARKTLYCSVPCGRNGRERNVFQERKSVFPEKRKKIQFFFRKGVAKIAFMWYNVSITFVD